MRKLMLAVALSAALMPWLALSERVKQTHTSATTRVFR